MCFNEAQKNYSNEEYSNQLQFKYEACCLNTPNLTVAHIRLMNGTSGVYVASLHIIHIIT